MGGLYYYPQLVEAIKPQLEEDFLITMFSKRYEEEYEEQIALYTNPDPKAILHYLGQHLNNIPHNGRKTYVETIPKTTHLHLINTILPALQTTNTPLQPTYCGTQYGENEIQQTILTETQKILQKRKDEYDEYNED